MMKKATLSFSQSSPARMQAYFHLAFYLKAAGNQESFDELSQILNGGLNIFKKYPVAKENWNIRSDLAFRLPVCSLL